MPGMAIEKSLAQHYCRIRLDGSRAGTVRICSVHLFVLQEKTMKNFAFPLFCLVGSLSLGHFAFSQEATATATAVRVPAASIPKMGPLTVTVDMMGGQKIVGTWTDITELPFKGAVGEVKILLSQVAGIKLASADDPSTTVVFKNGDSITGATDLQSISVDTEWGSAKINGSSITSLVLLPDLKWNAAIGLNGKRWSLVDSKNQQGVTVPSGTVLPTNTTTARPAVQPAVTRPGSPN